MSYYALAQEMILFIHIPRVVFAMTLGSVHSLPVSIGLGQAGENSVTINGVFEYGGKYNPFRIQENEYRIVSHARPSFERIETLAHTFS